MNGQRVRLHWKHVHDALSYCDLEFASGDDIRVVRVFCESVSCGWLVSFTYEGHVLYLLEKDKVDAIYEFEDGLKEYFREHSIEWVR